MPQRRRWIGLSLAVLALAAFAAVMAMRSAGQSRAGIEAWLQAAGLGLEQGDFRRPVMGGDAVPGNAMESYQRALALAEKLDADDELLRAAAGLDPDVAAAPEPTVLAELRRRWQPALADLRAGVHCAEMRPDIDWRGGFERPSIDAMAAMLLGRAAAAEARALLAAGDGRAAGDVMLDMLAFAADLARLPELVSAMVGSGIDDMVVELLSDRELRQLDRDTLRLLADALARVDDHWTGTVPHLRVEALMLSRAGLAPGGFSLLAWRNGFSGSAMYFEAMEQLTGGIDQIAAAESTRWPELQAALAQVARQWRASPNPLLRSVATNPVRFETQLRAARARLQLLRMAALFHAGEPVPRLTDPLGAGMLIDEATADGRRFASAGLGCDAGIERTAQR